jgi:circadian clock protein KaiC
MENAVLTGRAGSAVGPRLEKTSTGIPGLDQITGGGLPSGRVTLVAGAAGAGKTLLGMQFLVAGAREFGESGVLLTFEESAAKVAANVRSLGFDLAELERDGQLIVLSFRLDPTEIVATGEFDLEPIFVTLADAIDRVGARRVVLDTMEVLFGALGDDSIVRSELSRLTRWLEDRSVTAIVTAERGESSITRQGIEEYVSDCVIVLDQRVRDEISTRRLRVVKYRGSVHDTNEFPFLISSKGFVVLPITSVGLTYGAPEERISTGIGPLDRMLGGGVFRGSTIMVTGTAGTGKTALGAHFVHAACGRGERALWVLYEESPEQVLRNMRSIGLDLRPWVDASLLRIWASRPSAVGLEAHLAILAGLLEEAPPSVAVLDGIASLGYRANPPEVTSLLARKFDMLKASSTTTLATSLGHEDGLNTASVSSMVDTWLLLRDVEANGELNRLITVNKSRGSAHSNQAREFVLTDRGVELVDVYVGAEGVLTGSARLAQEAAERDAEAQRAEDLRRRRRDLRRSISEHKAYLAAARDELAAEQAEIDRIDHLDQHQTAAAEADRSAMAEHRWADQSTSDRRQQ